MVAQNEAKSWQSREGFWKDVVCLPWDLERYKAVISKPALPERGSSGSATETAWRLAERAAYPSHRGYQLDLHPVPADLGQRQSYLETFAFARRDGFDTLPIDVALAAYMHIHRRTKSQIHRFGTFMESHEAIAPDEVDPHIVREHLFLAIDPVCEPETGGRSSILTLSYTRSLDHRWVHWGVSLERYELSERLPLPDGAVLLLRRAG